MPLCQTAAVRAGGQVTGVIPEFLRAYEVGYVSGVNEIVVQSMHARKALMFEKSDAFVVVPGGIGTLEEALEILTWKQLQQHNKPVIFLNIRGYWDSFLACIDQVIIGGFGHHGLRQLFAVATTVDQTMAMLSCAQATNQQNAQRALGEPAPMHKDTSQPLLPRGRL